MNVRGCFAQHEMALAAAEEQEKAKQKAKEEKKPIPVAKGANFGKPPVLHPFSPRKWIWVPQYHGRLTYAERAELYHPMFQKNVESSTLEPRPHATLRTQLAKESARHAICSSRFIVRVRPDVQKCNRRRSRRR